MQFTNIRLCSKHSNGTVNLVNMVTHEVPTINDVYAYLVSIGVSPQNHKIEFSSSHFEVKTEPSFQTIIEINYRPDIIEDNEINYRQSLNIEGFSIPTISEIENQIEDAGYALEDIEYWYVTIPLFEQEPSFV